jgi:hypothetical protein
VAYFGQHRIPADSFGVDIMESEGASGPLAVALRYLSQGLPGFRGDLFEWSYQATFHERWPTLLMRYWWPRFTAPIARGYGPARIDFVRWIDEPGDCEAMILKAACETFRLRLAPD